MKKLINWFSVFAGLLSIQILFAQNVVRYDLTITDTIVNFSGKEKRAIAVNGQIPMPTLTFTEGDIAEIVVHNKLKEGTSLHWHGVFCPIKKMVCLISLKCLLLLIQHIPIVSPSFKTERTGITVIVACRSN